MDKLIEDHREEIRRLALLRGARRVRVFGSRARGDAGPDSDVDILIDLEKGRSALALGGLLMDLKRRTQCNASRPLIFIMSPD